MTRGPGWKKEIHGLLTLSAWPLADQAVVSASNFLTNIVIVRLLGTHDFGIFTLAWSMVLLAQLLQFCLVTTPMFNLAPNLDPERQRGYFSALLLFETCFAGAAGLLLFFGAAAGHLIDPEWPSLAFAAALAAAGAAYLWQDWGKRGLFTQLRAGMAALSDVFSYPLQLLILLLLIEWGPSLDRVLWVMAATSGLGAAVSIATLRVGRPARGLVAESAQRHWRLGRWMLVTAPPNWVTLNMIQLAGGSLLGVDAVAGIRAVALLFAAGNIFILSLDNFIPRHAAILLHQEGFPAFSRFMRQWVLIGVALGAALSLLLAAAPRFWLGLAFGPALAEYAWMIYPFALQFPMLCFIQISALGLRSAGLNSAVFRIWGGMAIIATASAFPAIYWFGLVGAMGSLLATYAAGCGLAFLFTRRAAELHRRQ
jgi:O-antigen/teichoic acid export membrane protein